MKASFVELRTKSSEIIQALHRNERVTVLYRGKPAAIMQPIAGAGGREIGNAADHPAFGLWADREETQNVPIHVRRLREGRLNAL